MLAPSQPPLQSVRQADHVYSVLLGGAIVLNSVAPMPPTPQS